MRRRTQSSTRLLPDGTPLRNRLLAELSTLEYKRIVEHLQVQVRVDGETIQEHRRHVDEVYFPNGGVFSTSMSVDAGSVTEVALVGREGMLGVGTFLGDRSASGHTVQRCQGGPVVAIAVPRFIRATVASRTFREVVALYAQVTLLRTMLCAACNARHDVTRRCCRWLLETHDRMDTDDFPLKHESLAAMLGVHRPTVSVVLRGLQEDGLVSSRYGRMRVLHRGHLEAASCECYAAIRGHFARLGLQL